MSVWDRVKYNACRVDGVAVLELTPKDNGLTSHDVADIARTLVATNNQISAVAEAYDLEGRKVSLGKYDRISATFADSPPLRSATLSIYTTIPQKLKKEDYWVIARHRRVAATGPKLWGMKVEEIQNLLGDLTHSDEVALSRQIFRRKGFEQANPSLKTAADLKKKIREMGIVAGSATKGGLIDILLAAEEGSIRPSIVSLDQYQQEVITVAIKYRPSKLLINAGPGAGKTTTLTHMIKQMVETYPSFRILVVAFNVNAESELKLRLRAMGVTALIPKDQTYQAPNGCAVLTFDKFAYQAQKAAPNHLLQMMQGMAVTDVGYNRSKEEAARIIAENPSLQNWNVVIVDEGQDVSDEAALVRSLTMNPETQLIVAGDPRQEVYSGATWYSNLWSTSPKECKRILYYNYRSAPDIVRALNAYSKEAFPTLHHDQIAVRDKADGQVLRIEECENSECIGVEASAIMAGEEPGDAYLIAPVTIEKMGMSDITQIVRQEMHERRVGSYTILLTGETKINVQEMVYYVATAKKIKGTEKPLAIVCGIDTDAYDRVVDHASLAKLIFVALSRAKDKLVLLTRPLVNVEGTKRKRISDLIAPFIEAAGGSVPNVPSPKMKLLWRVIPVTGSGIKTETGFSLTQSEFSTVYQELECGPKIHFEQDKYKSDSDFIGCMAESLVLEAAGAPVLQAKHCKINSVQDSGLCGIEHDGTNYIITVMSQNKNTLEECLVNPNGCGNAYFKTILKYTLSCGRLWTVSERHIGASGGSSEAELIVKHISKLLGDLSDIRPQKRYTIRLPDSRGNDAFINNKYTPDISGVADAYFPNAVPPGMEECDDPPKGVVLELKHTTTLNNLHRRQAAAYAFLQGCAGTLLYNTQTGDAEFVEPAKYCDVVDTGRAILALSLARQTVLTVLRKHALTPSKICLDTTVFISLDVETTRTDNGVMITEIGAVAVSATSWSVLGTFNMLNKGVRQMTPDEKPRFIPSIKCVDMGEKIARLRVVDESQLAIEDENLRLCFHMWLEQMSAARTFLHWGGNEKDVITSPITGELAGPCVDVYQSGYMPWLDLRGEKRQGSTTLTDAVTHLLPKLPFAPHQATEDAIAAMAIFFTTTSFQGIV